MKFCSACNLKVSVEAEICPLCKNTLDAFDDTPCAKFPEIVKRFDAHSYNILTRIFLFISIMASCVCILINVFTFQSSPYLWSLIVILGIMYVWLLIKHSILSDKNVSKKVIFQLLYISLVLVVIDKLFSNSNWSLNYAVPFLTLGTGIFIMIFIWVRFINYRDYMIYAITILLISLVPLLLVVVGFADVWWPSIACAAYAVICFIGLFIFADKAVSNELRKRFHL